MSGKTVLFCGHRCFAAQGLANALRDRGHRVLTFSRGPVRRNGDETTGPVLEIDRNPHLEEPVDTVINYIFLSREPIEDNKEYMRALLRYCESRQVKHLVHISSCSAYSNDAHEVTETSPIEIDPDKKGVYGAVKAAQEVAIGECHPERLKISIVRPGLILANGMGGFMGGIGMSLPWNSILGLGHARSQLPLVTREMANASVISLVENPPDAKVEEILLADKNSPTRREYVENCRDVMGAGTGVYFFPVPLWLTAAFCAQTLAKLLGKGEAGIYTKVASVCRYQRFDARASERRLGVSFSADWKRELARVFDDQEPNYDLPAREPKLRASTSARKVNFIGFGRIVKQLHLPALKHIGFRGALNAYDLNPGKDATGTEVQSIETSEVGSADLTVVATPGPVHTEVIERLQAVDGPVVVEKPLCYNEREFARWLEFAAGREAPVYACHNTRYKANVVKMLAHLRKYNPGKLHHVYALYQSGPVNKDSAAWLRDERGARTLLMDYGLHRVDLMCMFARGKARLDHCRHELNQQGETCFIEGSASFENHTVSFLFRQGLNQRKTRFLFIFQNYSISLGFYPDTFVAQMANDNFGLSWLETWQALKGTAGKVGDKLLGRNSEHSHARVFQAAIQGDADHPLCVHRLEPVYDLLFQISRSVYGDGE